MIINPINRSLINPVRSGNALLSDYQPTNIIGSYRLRNLEMEKLNNDSYPCLSLAQKLELSTLSPIQMRIEDYYLLRTLDIPNKYKDFLKRLCEQDCFNPKLIENSNCLGVAPNYLPHSQNTVNNVNNSISNAIQTPSMRLSVYGQNKMPQMSPDKLQTFLSQGMTANKIVTPNQINPTNPTLNTHSNVLSPNIAINGSQMLSNFISNGGNTGNNMSNNMNNKINSFFSPISNSTNNTANNNIFSGYNSGNNSGMGNVMNGNNGMGNNANTGMSTGQNNGYNIGFGNNLKTINPLNNISNPNQINNPNILNRNNPPLTNQSNPIQSNQIIPPNLANPIQNQPGSKQAINGQAWNHNQPLSMPLLAPSGPQVAEKQINLGNHSSLLNLTHLNHSLNINPQNDNSGNKNVEREEFKKIYGDWKLIDEARQGDFSIDCGLFGSQILTDESCLIQFQQLIVLKREMQSFRQHCLLNQHSMTNEQLRRNNEMWEQLMKFYEWRLHQFFIVSNHKLSNTKIRESAEQYFQMMFQKLTEAKEQVQKHGKEEKDIYRLLRQEYQNKLWLQKLQIWNKTSQVMQKQLEQTLKDDDSRYREEQRSGYSSRMESWCLQKQNEEQRRNESKICIVVIDKRKKVSKVYEESDSEQQKQLKDWNATRKKNHFAQNSQLLLSVEVNFLWQQSPINEIFQEKQLQFTLHTEVTPLAAKQIIKKRLEDQFNVRTDATLEFEQFKATQAKSRYATVVNVVQRKINLPEGYSYFPQSFSGFLVKDLKIWNKKGMIEWLKPINIEAVDFRDGIVLDDNTVGCDIDKLQGPIHVTFFDLPGKIKKMMRVESQERAKLRLQKLVRREGTLVDWDPLSNKYKVLIDSLIK